MQPGQVGAATGLGTTKTTYNDDILNCWTGIGTQLDGLGHLGVDDRYYNGQKWAEFADHHPAEEARHRQDPADGRARRAARHGGDFGVDVVKEGTAFNRAEIEARREARRRDQAGRRRALPHRLAEPDRKDPKRYGSVEPGLGRDGARYLVSKGRGRGRRRHLGPRGDPVRAGDDGVFEVHQILLPMNGTYILENMNTAELVKDKAWEFMFVLGQNKYQGAVQSMINPVAIR